MSVGEDNYTPDGRVVFLPIMGLVRYCSGESTTGKSDEIIQDKKEVSIHY